MQSQKGDSLNFYLSENVAVYTAEIIHLLVITNFEAEKIRDNTY